MARHGNPLDTAGDHRGSPHRCEHGFAMTELSIRKEEAYENPMA